MCGWVQGVSGGSLRRLDVLGCLHRLGQQRKSQSQSQSQLNTTGSMEAMSTSAEYGDDGKSDVLRDWRLVRVTGWLVHSDIVGKVLSCIPDSLQGHYVKTYPSLFPTPQKDNPYTASYSQLYYGVAVNASETMMAVSSSTLQQVLLYSLPSGEVLQTFGGQGSVGEKFVCPYRMMFVCEDGRETLLIADYGTSCIKEMSLSGDVVRKIGVGSATSFDVSGDKKLLVVGLSSAAMIVRYDNGEEVVRANDDFTSQVDGVRFTPSAEHFIATCYNAKCFKMYSVSDGSFVRKLCNGLGDGYWNDAYFAPSGEVVIADSSSRVISVFDEKGDSVLRQFTCDTTDDTDSVVKSFLPISLAYANSRLYVLDYNSGRVRVFE